MDCETIREWYKDFNIDEPKWQHTFGQRSDTRIGKNRAKSETAQPYLKITRTFDMEGSKKNTPEINRVRGSRASTPDQARGI